MDNNDDEAPKPVRPARCSKKKSVTIEDPKKEETKTEAYKRTPSKKASHEKANEEKCNDSKSGYKNVHDVTFKYGVKCDRSFSINIGKCPHTGGYIAKYFKKLTNTSSCQCKYCSNNEESDQIDYKHSINCNEVLMCQRKRKSGGAYMSNDSCRRGSNHSGSGRNSECQNDKPSAVMLHALNGGNCQSHQSHAREDNVPISYNNLQPSENFHGDKEILPLENDQPKTEQLATYEQCKELVLKQIKNKQKQKKLEQLIKEIVEKEIAKLEKNKRECVSEQKKKESRDKTKELPSKEVKYESQEKNAKMRLEQNLPSKDECEFKQKQFNELENCQLKHEFKGRQALNKILVFENEECEEQMQIIKDLIAQEKLRIEQNNLNKTKLEKEKLEQIKLDLKRQLELEKLRQEQDKFNREQCKPIQYEQEQCYNDRSHQGLLNPNMVDRHQMEICAQQFCQIANEEQICQRQKQLEKSVDHANDDCFDGQGFVNNEVPIYCCNEIPQYYVERHEPEKNNWVNGNENINFSVENALISLNNMDENSEIKHLIKCLFYINCLLKYDNAKLEIDMLANKSENIL